MKRVCVFTGSRADYSRLKLVIKEIERQDALETKLVVAGTHLIEKHGETINEILADGIRVDGRVFTLIEGENPITMAKSVGMTIFEMATVYQNFQPDIVVVHGDRFETFGAVVASTMMNIITAHIQGGEVSGSIDESLRHSITKLSHIHFVSNEDSRQRVIKMGEDPETVFNVGCPMVDSVLSCELYDRESASKHLKKIIKSKTVYDFDKPYVIAIMHPVTTAYGDNHTPVYNMLRALEKLKLQTILLWPNADAGAREVVSGIKRFFSNKVSDVPMDVTDNIYMKLFLSLLKHAACIVGNSSAGIREACYFGTPVVNIGSRQQGRVRADNVIDASDGYEDILEKISIQLNHGRFDVEMPYGDGSSSKKIVDILNKIRLPSTQKRITY